MAHTVLVTGVNGHLGSNLARALLTRGYRVRGLVRASSNRAMLEGLDLDLVVGDVLDGRRVAEALEGADGLVHLAAPTVVATADDHRAFSEGVSNVFEAARRTRTLERAVYVSSTVTVGITASPADVLTEDSEQRLSGSSIQGEKWSAERWVRDFAARTRLPTVVVNPAMIIGPGDVRPTPPNRLILDFVNHAGGLDWLRPLNLNAAPVYFRGGLSVVDAEDAARGIGLAYERGREGERYILAGDNVTYRQFFGVLGELTGLPGPWIPVPRSAMLGASLLLTLALKHPPLPYRLVRTMVGRYAYFSSAKAVRELGYTWRSHRDALRRAVEWLLAKSFVHAARRPRLEAALARS